MALGKRSQSDRELRSADHLTNVQTDRQRQTLISLLCHSVLGMIFLSLLIWLPLIVPMLPSLSPASSNSLSYSQRSQK